MTPVPLQLGQAPSELALNSAGFTPLAFANALRIGSRSPVYVAGLLRREPLIAAWSTVTTPSRPDTEPWISELFPAPGHPGHEDQHAEWNVDVDVLHVVGAGAAHLQHGGSRSHRRLEGGPVVQVSPGRCAAGQQPLDGALEHHLAPARVKVFVTVLPPARSIVISPLARTEGTLKENALGEPTCGCPSRLNRIRSIALASVAVPTVERGSAPVRCWSTMIAVVNHSSTSTSGRASVGMKPCTEAL
jgi:hypothetical protein